MKSTHDSIRFMRLAQNSWSSVVITKDSGPSVGDAFAAATHDHDLKPRDVAGADEGFLLRKSAEATGAVVNPVGMIGIHGDDRTEIRSLLLDGRVQER